MSGPIFTVPGTRNFKGDIDEVAIFNRALTSPELTAALYDGHRHARWHRPSSSSRRPRASIPPTRPTLTVLADGSGPITYQWQIQWRPILTNGSGITGAEHGHPDSESNATAGQRR
jgi:hypothetical protein